MVKQSLVGAVAIVALASAAHGADLQPVLKAPRGRAAGDRLCGGLRRLGRTRPTNLGESERFNGWALGGAVAATTG